MTKYLVIVVQGIKQGTSFVLKFSICFNTCTAHFPCQAQGFKSHCYYSNSLRIYMSLFFSILKPNLLTIRILYQASKKISFWNNAGKKHHFWNQNRRSDSTGCHRMNQYHTRENIFYKSKLQTLKLVQL